MDQHIKDILKKYVNKSVLENGVISQRIEDFWKKQMSPTIISRTRNMSYSEGKLVLFFDSSALKNEMFNSRDKVKNMINTYFEEEIVKEVIIR